jgi:hypothetical protein
MLEIYPQIRFNGMVLTDISRRYIIKNIETAYTENIYFSHIMTTWKSPENIAYDFYGSCDYVWAIYLINNIINPFDDWLLKDEEVKILAEKKYGNTVNNIHHYELNGIIYKTPMIGSTAVTNIQYELDRNELKRTIKVIYPKFIEQVKTDIIKYFN